MKIIKPGEIPKETIRFSCGYCGCIFEADKGEYEKGPTYDPDYTCRCPTCGRGCSAPCKEDNYFMGL